MQDDEKRELFETCLSLAERKFINYLKKWYLGVRNDFIKKEIKRNKELEIDIGTDEKLDIQKLYSYLDADIDDYAENIENRELYWLIMNLPEKRREVIKCTIFEGIPLSEVAAKIGISKQLAYAYKVQFLEHAKQIIEKNRKNKDNL